ncbi:MAG: Ig-like domain-containing protein [Bacteroidetes bacterium]|nr:Ig-like domain-containing protein [Bacteroidota bacterium]
MSCAQITAPTGGARDTTPPKITLSNPSNHSINFQQKEIYIAFDEWIQPLTNPKNQVIISPEITPFPDIHIARNDLHIKFKDTLLSNTTYSLYFADNIKDNNEGNPYSNFKYVFSTGNFIDSLQLKGQIATSLEKFPDNTYLLLYKDLDDSAFLKKRPFYITKVGTDGHFNLENVKEGTYKIYALDDKNSNYYYDLPTEAIAFLDSAKHINSSIDILHLNLFLPEENKLRIQSFDREIKNGIWHLSFNKELSLNKDEITVRLINDKTIEPIAFTDKDQHNMSVYFPSLPKDTANIKLVVANNGNLIDTIRTNISTTKINNIIPFFSDSTLNKGLKAIESDALVLESSVYSLSSIDTSKIYIEDTTHNKIPFSIKRLENLRDYQLTANWKPNMLYKLTFLDSSMQDLAKNYNVQQEFSFLTIANNKTGNLLITFELPSKNENYIAILKDNSGKVWNKQILRDSQRIQINYGRLLPGNYSVEVIEDANKNGIWNSGNYILKTEPEKIFKSQPIIIKENWDADEIINVDFIRNTIISNNQIIKKPNSKGPPKDILDK